MSFHSDIEFPKSTKKEVSFDLSCRPLEAYASKVSNPHSISLMASGTPVKLRTVNPL